MSQGALALLVLLLHPGGEGDEGGREMREGDEGGRWREGEREMREGGIEMREVGKGEGGERDCESLPRNHIHKSGRVFAFRLNIYPPSYLSTL